MNADQPITNSLGSEGEFQARIADDNKLRVCHPYHRKPWTLTRVAQLLYTVLARINEAPTWPPVRHHMRFQK